MTELNIKQQFHLKKNALKEDIYNLIKDFEKDTGVDVHSIDTDYSYEVFSFRIYTNIDKPLNLLFSNQ